ncbi:M1 family aminopeptidase [Nonlabens sp. Asnod2-A12]|uniref:M1 family aminopeptidase n=1 Tax=Nonlabens sp. Asnod2-A12 TaxID=3160578 RepID=UPI003869AD5F
MKNFKIMYLIVLVLAFAKAEQSQAQITTSQEGVDACLLKSTLFNSGNRVVNGLTANYDLKYVRLELDVDPDVAVISGTVTSHFTAVGDMDQVVFDLASNMVVSQVTQRGTALNFINNGNDELVIDLPAIQNNSVLDSLSVTYSGNPIASGFGSFAQTTHNNAGIIWTLSEPYGAKAWWPCKQDLNDKIDQTDVILNVPTGNTGISNGLMTSENITPTGKTFKWQHNHPIPAYLIAIAVTNYSKYTEMVGSGATAFPIDNYVYPENLVSAQSSTAVTVPIMNFFENTFGPYPFRDEKYGHAQFGWGGGMEHTTISFMGNFSRGLIAHELAHQWFGNKVTCGSWQDIWLNESFATYSTGMTVEHLDGNDAFKSWRVNANNRATTDLDGSVYVPATDTLSVGRVFNGNLSYNKGGMVLHMLRKKLGDADFEQTLQNYLNDTQLAYNYAKTPQFKSIAETTSGQNLDEFFNDWIYGEGYPQHNINWIDIPNGISINYIQTPTHPSVSLFEMQLPIKIIGAAGEVQWDTILVNSLTQNKRIRVPFVVSSIEIDPDVDTISKNNTATLGLDTAFAKAEYQLYPNPTSSTFQIIGIQEDFTALKIYDLHGRMIIDYKKQLLNNPSLTFKAPQNSGIYFLNLTTERGTTIEKLLVR